VPHKVEDGAAVRSIAAAVAALVALPLLVVVLVLGTISGPGAPGVPAAAVTSTPGTGGSTAAANKELAAHLAAEFGWTGPQFTCLDELWTRESGFSETALNGESGAYGIAQALGHIPGVSVALNRQGDNYPPPFTSANAPPWGHSDPVAQISWGLGYIADTYTTPCGAWAHEEASGFY
jgi:resuscitation-promoting factor RpfB